MKALVLAAALAALSSAALAGAAHEASPQAETPTAAVMADASRLGSAGLTALNNGWPQADAHHPAQADTELDTGTLVIGLGALALVLFRPVGRALRRLERERRAAALSSTLPRR